LFLDPCMDQQLFTGNPYTVGLLSCPNSTILWWSSAESNLQRKEDVEITTVSRWFTTSDWFTRQNFQREPCSAGASENLTANGCTVAPYQLQGDGFQVLKTVPSEEKLRSLAEDRARVKNGTLASCCTETATVYSRDGSTPPIYTMQMDPNGFSNSAFDTGPVFKHCNGVAVMLPVLVQSKFGLSSTDVRLLHPLVYSDEDRLNLECSLCSRWDPEEFLGNFSAEVGDVGGLKFCCSLNITCSWGPLLCGTCLDRMHDNTPLPRWFDEFVQDKYSDGSGMTEADREKARSRACDTFCSTTVAVWFTGLDADSRYLRSGRLMPRMLKHSPFQFLRLFQDMYGLSDKLLDSLRTAGLT